MNAWVLSTFIDRWLLIVHLRNFMSSELHVCKSWSYKWFLNKSIVSSANRINDITLKILFKSFIYNVNNSEANIVPRGTPILHGDPPEHDSPIQIDDGQWGCSQIILKPCLLYHELQVFAAIYNDWQCRILFNIQQIFQQKTV